MTNVCPNCAHRGAERACPHDGFPMVDAERYGSSARPDDLVGRVFDGKYEVESLLGRGGMGAVWRARHLVMQHPVALKVMHHDVGAGLNAVKRFYNEARACCRLRHPNTIRVTDFGATDDGFLYMAMELLEGGDLAALLRHGPLAPRRALRILAQVCKSLDEAHEAGMVHRDLKPSNLFLTEIHGEDDFVKVIDFGIAKAIGAAAGAGQSLTQTGLVVGTPRYLSPEQIRDATVDRRADLYAVGVLLYELLTGGIPFDATSTSALLLAHATQPPKPLPDTLSGVPTPPALRALVTRLLDKEPAGRPATAADVSRDLLTIADRLDAGAAGAVAAGVAATAEAAAPSAAPAVEPARTAALTPAPDAAAFDFVPVTQALVGGTPAPTAAPAAVAPVVSAPTTEAHPSIPVVETHGLRVPSSGAAPRRRRALYAGGVGALVVAAVVAFLLLRPPTAERTADPPAAAGATGRGVGAGSSPDAGPSALPEPATPTALAAPAAPAPAAPAGAAGAASAVAVAPPEDVVAPEAPDASPALPTDATSAGVQDVRADAGAPTRALEAAAPDVAPVGEAPDGVSTPALDPAAERPARPRRERRPKPRLRQPTQPEEKPAPAAPPKRSIEIDYDL